MTKNEAVEAVLERFEDANSELHARLYDHDPERVKKLSYRLADIIDQIACMEEAEEDEAEDEEWTPYNADYCDVGSRHHY